MEFISQLEDKTSIGDFAGNYYAEGNRGLQRFVGT